MLTDSVADGDEPITVEEAIQRLDADEITGLVKDVWKRRGWSLAGERASGDYVEFLLEKEWPRKRRAIVRVVRQPPEGSVGETGVRHFVRAAQREDVDWGHLVTSGHVSDRVGSRGRAYDIEVVDGEALARLIERSGCRDLVARDVDPPLAESRDSLAFRVTRRLRWIAARNEAVGSLGQTLRERLPAGIGARVTGRQGSSGFRLAVTVAAACFLLMLVSETGSMAFWSLTAAFLFVVYGGVLPLLAIDLYETRRSPTSDWNPSWWHLVAFLLPPVALVVAGVYWYRQTRSRSNRA